MGFNSGLKGLNMLQKQREEMNPLITDHRKGDCDDRLWENEVTLLPSRVAVFS
jgi:hypothetical protein